MVRKPRPLRITGRSSVLCIDMTPWHVIRCGYLKNFACGVRLLKALKRYMHKKNLGIQVSMQAYQHLNPAVAFIHNIYQLIVINVSNGDIV